MVKRQLFHFYRLKISFLHKNLIFNAAFLRYAKICHCTYFITPYSARILTVKIIDKNDVIGSYITRIGIEGMAVRIGYSLGNIQKND